MPILVPTHSAAQAYETLATTRPAVMPPMPYSGYLQPVTDAAFGTPFTHVTDPGQQMKSAIATFQRIRVVVVTSAAPTSPNTLINTAPAMVLATPRDEQCSGGSLVPGHGHHVHLRTGAGSDHLADEKDTQCGHASVYSYAGQTVRLRRCEQDHRPEKRDHEGDAESAMP